MSLFCEFLKSKDALAILYAAETGDHRAMRVLLERGVHPDSARGRRLETALFVATERGHVDVVRTLLEHGADPTITNEDCAGAITLAASMGRVDLIELMKDFRSDTFHEPAAVLALHQASLGAHPDVLQVLLDGGAHVDVCLPTHPPVLHSAAMSCALCVEKLLDAGADPNCTDQQGLTPLHLAAWADKFDCVHVLMKAGAHVDARSVDDRLPWQESRTERMRNLMLRYFHSRSTPPLSQPSLSHGSQSSPLAQSNEQLPSERIGEGAPQNLQRAGSDGAAGPSDTASPGADPSHDVSTFPTAGPSGETSPGAASSQCAPACSAAGPSGVTSPGTSTSSNDAPATSSAETSGESLPATSSSPVADASGWTFQGTFPYLEPNLSQKSLATDVAVEKIIYGRKIQ